jgi:hypothetical protein
MRADSAVAVYGLGMLLLGRRRGETRLGQVGDIPGGIGFGSCGVPAPITLTIVPWTWLWLFFGIDFKDPVELSLIRDLFLDIRVVFALFVWEGWPITDGLMVSKSSQTSLSTE